MTLAALIGLTAGAFAQETQMTQMKFEGQPFVLNEFGAIIIGNDGILEIQIMAMESDQRQPAYRKIDLKTGDQIVMATANGSSLPPTWKKSTTPSKWVKQLLSPSNAIRHAR